MTESEQVKAPEDMTFAQMMAELDGIVAQLEGNQLELEESLGRYERGVELLRASRVRLDDARQKVTALIGIIEPLDDEAVDERLS
jgi:exodeoxyribonuclease VII small subunit